MEEITKEEEYEVCKYCAGEGLIWFAIFDDPDRDAYFEECGGCLGQGVTLIEV